MDEVAICVLPSFISKGTAPKEAAEQAFQYAEALWDKRNELQTKSRSQGAGKVGMGVIASLTNYNLEP